MAKQFFESQILGMGKSVPEKVVTNHDLAKTLDTSHKWIVERTGIHERRISSTDGGEFPSDLGQRAALEAIENAKVELDDIDAIIVASASPDMKLPNTASLIQKKLGIKNHCACMDLAAACSGFTYAYIMADSLIATSRAKHVLVIGAEMLSTIVDWEDRNTCILLGDGAGAAVLGRSSNPDSAKLMASHWANDSEGIELFNQPVGGSYSPATAERIEKKEQYVRMRGRDMFKVATRTLAKNASKVCEMAEIGPEEVDWLIPHQANLRIIETTAKLMNFPMDKVIVNIDKYANTSAASIPMAMYEGIKDGRIKRGQTLLLDAFGAGLTSGAVLLKY